MRRVIMLGGRCDKCMEGSITLQAAPLYVSRRYWIDIGVAVTLGLFIGVLL